MTRPDSIGSTCNFKSALFIGNNVQGGVARWRGNNCKTSISGSNPDGASTFLSKGSTLGGAIRNRRIRAAIAGYASRARANAMAARTSRMRAGGSDVMTDPILAVATV